MACSSLPVSMVMAVAARAAVSAALAGGNRLGWRRTAGGCWFHSCQAASVCGPRPANWAAGAWRSTQDATMPRSLSGLPGVTPFPAGLVSSRVSRVPVQCWAASAGWPAGSGCGGTSRRSAPQYSCRLMVLAQLPGGLSPAWPARPRGARPQDGQVSQSRTWWVVQANNQPSRQDSGHRPFRSARHDAQYRDPRRRTGPSGR